MGFESVKRTEVVAIKDAVRDGDLRLLQLFSGKADLQSGLYEILKRHIECDESLIDSRHKALERLIQEAPFERITVLKDLVIDGETDYFTAGGGVEITSVDEIHMIKQKVGNARENYVISVPNPPTNGIYTPPISVELDPYLEYVEVLVEYLLTNPNGAIQIIVPLYEYVLSPKELRKHSRMVPASPSDPGYDEEARPALRAPNWRDNFPNFKEDSLSSRIDGYRGTFVAYYQGILCGQSKNRNLLYQKATEIYDTEEIAVFKVPELAMMGIGTSLTEDAVGKF